MRHLVQVKSQSEVLRRLLSPDRQETYLTVILQVYISKILQNLHLTILRTSIDRVQFLVEIFGSYSNKENPTTSVS